jgi:hypothetical protein
MVLFVSCNHDINFRPRCYNFIDRSQMPYLHWAVSGESLNYRNALVSEVIENARDPGYIRPTPEEIEQMEHSVDMKILRAFLLPAYDRCLHVPKTLNQYYYSTLTDVDESFRDQVVYKFAMKRHENRMEELARAKEEEKARRVRLRESRRWERDEVSSETRSGSWNGRLVVDVDPEEEDPRRLEPSWDPPKIIMV